MTYQTKETIEEDKKGIQVELTKMLEMAKVSDKLIMPQIVLDYCPKDKRAWVLVDMRGK